MAALTVPQAVAEFCTNANRNSGITTLKIQLRNTSGTLCGSGTVDLNRGLSTVSGLSLSRAGAALTIDFTNMTFESNGSGGWLTAVDRLYVELDTATDAVQSCDISLGSSYDMSANGAKLIIDKITITFS